MKVQARHSNNERHVAPDHRPACVPIDERRRHCLGLMVGTLAVVLIGWTPLRVVQAASSPKPASSPYASHRAKHTARYRRRPAASLHASRPASLQRVQLRKSGRRLRQGPADDMNRLRPRYHDAHRLTP